MRARDRLADGLRLTGLLVIAWNLPGPDVARVAALARAAEAEAPSDLTAPIWLEAAREASRVRPWQDGWREARALTRRVGDARRDAARAEGWP